MSRFVPLRGSIALTSVRDDGCGLLVNTSHVGIENRYCRIGDGVGIGGVQPFIFVIKWLIKFRISIMWRIVPGIIKTYGPLCRLGHLSGKGRARNLRIVKKQGLEKRRKNSPAPRKYRFQEPIGRHRYHRNALDRDGILPSRCTARASGLEDTTTRLHFLNPH